MIITGTYTQQSSGTLLIKALNAKAGNWGRLAVSDQVTLGGTLRLRALRGASFKNGDTIAVLTSPTPIAGQFSQFTAEHLPPGVTARVIYESNQVLIKFKVAKIDPPTHLKGVQLKECVCGKLEFTNRLTWKGSKTPTVVSYLIERNGKEIAKVSGNTFDDVNQPPVSAKYEVFAVDKSGLKSKPAVVVVAPYKPSCQCFTN